MDEIFEVMQKLDSGDYYVAIIDGNTGTVVVRGWTTQPVNWLEWSDKIRVEYIRLTRRGVSPAHAAKAARMSVMANGPSTMRFIERMELVPELFTEDVEQG